MFKKTNLVRMIMSFALAVTLLLGMTLPAMADDEIELIDVENVKYGTPSNPVQAAITKLLRMPVGTTIPNNVFEFQVTNVSRNKDPNASMPILGINSKFTLTFTSTTDPNPEFIDQAVVYSTETDDIFAGIEWKDYGTGHYIFELEEIIPVDKNENSLDGVLIDKDDYKERMTYSKASYKLNVYVKEDNGQYYVYAIGALKVTDDDSTGVGDKKVDPTPGGGSSEEYDYSQMIFTNDYIKYQGSGPETPNPDPNDSALTISKEVSGDSAEKDRYFEFHITLNKTISTNSTDNVGYYRVYLMDSSGVVSPAIENNTTADIIPTNHATLASTRGAYMQFTKDDMITIWLKPGQRLEVVDMPVGSSYIVGEPGEPFYLATYMHTINGENPVEGTASGEGSPLFTNQDTIGVGQKTPIGEGANIVEFLNKAQDMVYTGVAMDDLPYIAVLALIIGAGVAFMVIKYRKAAQLSAE